MSNYNSIIQQNNTELEDILDTVNALPDAGIKEEDITAELLQSIDPDFKAANIAEGVNMFGVAGTFAGGGKVASGQAMAVMTGSQAGGSISLTVTGLGFKPDHVMLIQTKQLNSYVSAYYDGSGVFGGYTSSTKADRSTSCGTLTFNSDGFTIYKGPLYTGNFSQLDTRYPYDWVAWQD